MKGHGLIPGLIQRSFVGPRVFTLGTHSINFYSPNIYGDELASGIIGPAGNPIALLADLAHRTGYKLPSPSSSNLRSFPIRAIFHNHNEEARVINSSFIFDYAIQLRDIKKKPEQTRYSGY
ncbi:hypothetical protein TWF569_009809 [Orbilia oligospora]|uniref:Uncharacterized protein n=1 Tax=Orbilia oligospora TaxID=2813651 RepID=A0A7C8JSS1_ORBOL|nr:hypothetical protein TWF102_004132 [Orbilia oligospora]KAF3155284.1 hypothetical protein TWF569_009809 [Orbilia oligospora]